MLMLTILMSDFIILKDGTAISHEMIDYITYINNKNSWI